MHEDYDDKNAKDPVRLKIGTRLSNSRTDISYIGEVDDGKKIVKF